jgi:hypothetical protein
LSAANSQEIARALPSSSAGSSASLRRSDVEHDRSGLEQHEAVVFEERHLPEGLARAVVGGRLVVGVDQPRAVSEARLFERPPHPKVAHLALRERRHPLEGRDGDHGCSLIC